MPPSAIGKCVRGIDIMTLMIGVKLLPGRRYVQVLNYFLYVVYICNIVVSFVLHITTLTDGKLLSWVKLKYYLVCAFAVQTLLALKRKQLITLFADVIAQCSPSQQRLLTRLSFATLAMYCCCAVVSIVGYHEQIKAENFERTAKMFYGWTYEEMNVWQIMFVYAHLGFVIPVLRNQWLNCALFVHTFALVGIDIVTTNFLCKAHTAISMGPSAELFKHLIKTKRKYDQLKRNLEEFNLLPFLWFSYMFVALSGYISHLRHVLKLQRFWMRVMVLLSRFLIDSTFIIGQLLYMRYAKGKHDDIKRNIETKLDELQGVGAQYCMMNRDLKDAIKEEVCLTGLGIITLDQKLIINFMSAIVTFTVLFIQITE